MDHLNLPSMHFKAKVSMWWDSNGAQKWERWACCPGMSLVYVCVCPVPVKTAGGYRRSCGCQFGRKAERWQKTMICNRQTGKQGQGEGWRDRGWGDEGRKREAVAEKRDEWREYMRTKSWVTVGNHRELKRGREGWNCQGKQVRRKKEVEIPEGGKGKKKEQGCRKWG